MSSLRQFLTEKKYKRIRLKTTATKHLEIAATINGVEGTFILDTGASNSCVGNDSADHFNLLSKETDIKIGGSTSSNQLFARISSKNTLKIGDWKKKKINLVLFDLGHINSVLNKEEVKSFDGIIGADILEKGKAVIDYKRKCLYLK